MKVHYCPRHPRAKQHSFNKKGDCYLCKDRLRYASIAYSTSRAKFSSAKYSAKKRGRWELTFEEWHNIVTQPCVYAICPEEGIRTGVDQKVGQPYANMGEERKAYALEFLRPENKEFSAVLFAMLDGKDVNKVIWKIVKRMTLNGHPLRDAQFT